MSLDPEKVYFLALAEAVLRKNPKKTLTRNAINHLILGDTIEYLNESENGWVKVNARRNTGWLKEEWLTDQRLLEVNFVDIGQGDGCHIITPDNEILLIDAGEGVGFDGKGGDNMLRFLSWRYNLRSDQEEKSLTLDYAIISHPDLDHYYGFHSLFNAPGIRVNKVCHNGIVERSIKDGSSSTWLFDLGRKVPPLPYKRKYHLWDTVRTHKDMIKLLESQSKSNKYYLKTLLSAYRNNRHITFKFLQQSQGFLDHFSADNPLQIEILAPLTESIEFKGETKPCLIKLGNESQTKNGHSVVFQLRYGKLKMLLGGDLNSKSQDYLAQFYSGIPTKMSDLEKDIQRLRRQLSDTDSASAKDQQQAFQELDEKEKLLDLIIAKTRRKFGTDIAKACHHGSSDVLEAFLAAISPIATIISSGDGESHAHPRPDALGAYGKFSRGKRPLLFSTELARSTNEFTYPYKYYNLLKKLEERMNELTDEGDKAIYQQRMERMRDSNVARYGMITVRTDGEQVIIAQKLEQKRSNAQKWDLYHLKWNKTQNTFEAV